MEHPSFHVQHYIDGAFVEGTHRFEIFYPATNQVIGSAPEGREDEVDAAVQAATRAFASWGARWRR
jgi:NAD-dependent aldehyde dehydrogenases